MYSVGGNAFPSDASSAVISLLWEQMVRQEVMDMESPHIVICRSLETGTVTYQGPYGSGLEALAAAESEAAMEAAHGSSLQFSVAPLSSG